MWLLISSLLSTARQRLHRASAGAEAEALAQVLLKQYLCPTQLEQFKREGSFVVVGSDTGKTYRIRSGTVSKIDELDGGGRRICSWCFHPVGSLPTGDVLLAQKIALETFELYAIGIATKHAAAHALGAAPFLNGS
jgi:hypothetical protein